MIRPLGVLLVFALTLMPRAHAQDQVSNVAQATDFSIPASPAFALLDVNPAKVHTPGFPRDFRIDWITREGRLVSDLALEVAPIWLLGFNDATATEYQQANRFLQTLSTLNLSVGTAQKGDEFFLSASAKVSLFRAVDPMTDASYLKDLTDALSFAPGEKVVLRRFSNLEEKADDDTSLGDDQAEAVFELIKEARNSVVFIPDSVAAYASLPAGDKNALAPYIDEINTIQADLVPIAEATSAALRSVREAYERKHWNSTRLDLGAGRVWTYDNPALDSLRFQDAGLGVWLNGAYGFGTERWLLSGLGRLLEEAGETTYFLGANVRYGFNDINLFIEYVFESLADGDLHTISYGGVFALSSEFTVEFGLRTPLESEFETSRFLPVVKVNGRALNELVSPLAARL